MGWSVLSASVSGVAHRQLGKGCDDHSHWFIAGEDVLVAAVADGAGSASLANIGSEIAAVSAVHTLACLPEVVLRNSGDHYFLLNKAFRVGQEALRDEAHHLGVAPRELATTLTLVVAQPDSVTVAQIGDGACVVLDRRRELITLAHPMVGEYANETEFLTDRDAEKHIAVRTWMGESVAIALTSDGLQRIALSFPEASPHPPFFLPLFDFARSTKQPEGTLRLSEFLGSPRIAERTDDDVTLLLATRSTQNCP